MNAEYLGALVTLVAALIGATITLWLGIGRRQRLRLAIEVREGIEEEQRFEWDEMVRRDVTAITHASLQPIKPGPLWVIGLLLSSASFLPGMPPAIRLALQLVSITFILTALIAFLLFRRRVKTYTKGLQERLEQTKAEVETLKASMAEAEDQLAALERTIALRLDSLSRVLYDKGAPMAVVRQARVEQDLSKIPDESDFDLPSWRLRRRLRRVSPFRKRYGFTGHEPPTENGPPGLDHDQEEASDQQSRTPGSG